MSRALISNSDKEYKKLGNVIADARLAGMIDWNAIVDRTRYVRDLSHWGSPAGMIKACSSQFRLNKWDRQPEYLEVWIEKDALIGVIENVCQENDVPFMACRGYASASEVWRAGCGRIKPRVQAGKKATVLYLGDHDPSGIDMTRDVRDRLKLFVGATLAHRVTVERLALNMDQVELYNPPPNPTKLKDSRAKSYLEDFGEECWELDALDPIVIRDLIESSIQARRDDELWQEAVEEEQVARAHLARIADNWDDVISNLPDLG